MTKGQESKVLKRSLYGLKQSSRMWYKKFDTHVQSIGFIKCDFDNCVYVLRKHSATFLLLYVDDMLLASRSMAEIIEVKNPFSKVGVGSSSFLFDKCLQSAEKRRKTTRKTFLRESQKSKSEKVKVQVQVKDGKGKEGKERKTASKEKQKPPD